MNHRSAKNINCKECPFIKDSFFCGLSHIELDFLSREKSQGKYTKGQIIFYEGNFPHGLYCIHSGKVKISKLGEGGKEQIVRFAREQDLIGYRALLGNEHYYATATVMSDAEICFIPKEKLFDILKTNADFSLKTIQLLTGNVKVAEEKLMNMAQKRVRERVAEAILVLENCFGLKEDGKTIDTNILRRELASVAGTTIESTIRLMSEFTREGIIESDNKTISIINKPMLVKIANLPD